MPPTPHSSLKRDLGGSTPPLTAAAREALALFEALDAADDDAHDAHGDAQNYRSKTLPAGPSVVQPARLDSPYIKIPLAHANRASGIGHAGTSVAKASKFKPLLPRSKVKPAEVPLRGPPVSPPKLRKSVLVGQNTAEHREQSLHEQLPSLKRAMSYTSNEIAPQAVTSPAFRPVRTVPATKTAFLYPLASTSHQSAADNLPPSDNYDESVTTVPSSRTPSQEELQGPSIHVTANTRGLRRRPPPSTDNSQAVNDGFTKEKDTGTRLRGRRALHRSETSPSGIHIRESDVSHQQNPDEAASSRKKKKSSKGTKPVSSSAPVRSRPPSKRTRTARSGKTEDDTHSKMGEPGEDNASNGSQEGCALLPSAFVAILPKRKAARKTAKRIKTNKADTEEGESNDETSQYIRENWESSASSSDDDTDYDDSDGITRIK